MRIAAEAIEIGPGQSQGELLVRLVGTPAQGPALLEVAVELPSGLVLPAANRLAAATALPTLDGDFVANRYVVLCGDAENSDAAILQPGDLFRLRVQPASPRTAGSYTVRFVSLRGASRNGIDDVLVDSAPLTTTVVVR